MQLSRQITELWPNQNTALRFLRGIVEPDVAVAAPISAEQSTNLAAWLANQGLGPIVRQRYASSYPELAQQLQVDSMLAATEISLFRDALCAMLEVLNQSAIDVVLLKGMALALTAYPEQALRPMSDVDVWINSTAIDKAIASLTTAGFEQINRPKNTPALQLSAHGKIKFNLPDWYIGGIEIHTNPFAGTLLNRTARVDLAALWSCKQPLKVATQAAYRLSAEDMILQVATHLAISNQFCVAVLRGLLDIALTARHFTIDWAALANRALRWRIAVPIWLTLTYADAIFGLPGVARALAVLQPSRMRRKLLAHYITLDHILVGYDFRTKQNRHAYLALLISPPSIR